MVECASMHQIIDPKKLPRIDGAEVCILKSKWHQEHSDNMEKAARPILEKAGATRIDTEILPGCLELPLAIRHIEEHSSVSYDAYICLGIILKGKTQHFEMILQACGMGMSELSIRYSKPVINAVIPALTLTDVKKRTKMDKLNKGIEAAVAAIEMIAWQRSRM
jgi:6,7-dimethyl-8-ribityllumazine synthase